MSIARQADARSSERASVFLSAVLHVGGSSCAVRIRNLSDAGALIDGKDMPNVGDAVRLQRGPYVAIARVVWRDESGCGVRFASTVPVQQWIAYASGHSEQQHVDEALASVRAGEGAGPHVELAGGLKAVDRARTAEELEIISDQLDEIALAFAAIPGAVEQASTALQDLDIAKQRLADLAARIRSGRG